MEQRSGPRMNPHLGGHLCISFGQREEGALRELQLSRKGREARLHVRGGEIAELGTHEPQA